MRRWKGQDKRPLRGLTREQAAIWTVVHEAFGAVWMSLELANRLIDQSQPIERIVKKLATKKGRVRSSSLAPEQKAVGELMCAAVREYSESHYCAGWYSDIEHQLWDEVVLRKEDAYERACVKLSKLAGAGRWRRPRSRSLFAEGLKLLSERYGIWFFYESGKGERVVSLKEWLSLHKSWITEQTKERMPYQRAWELAHFTPFKKKRRKVPPMPNIKLPPINA